MLRAFCPTAKCTRMVFEVVDSVDGPSVNFTFSYDPGATFLAVRSEQNPDRRGPRSEAEMGFLLTDLLRGGPDLNAAGVRGHCRERHHAELTLRAIVDGLDRYRSSGKIQTIPATAVLTP